MCVYVCACVDRFLALLVLLVMIDGGFSVQELAQAFFFFTSISVWAFPMHSLYCDCIELWKFFILFEIIYNKLQCELFSPSWLLV